MTLDDLPLQTPATVTGFQTDDTGLETRLREIGFAEGDSVYIRHVGLIGRNPITVALNDAHIALRRLEARAINVKLSDA